MKDMKRGAAAPFRQRRQTGTGMDNDILTNIVEVEEEIRERLIAEQRSAGTMLCSLRLELEGETGREEERLAAARRDAEAAARAEAQEQAAVIVQHATGRAERLARVDDGILERCIVKHLLRIMPEESR